MQLHLLLFVRPLNPIFLCQCDSSENTEGRIFLSLCVMTSVCKVAPQEGPVTQSEPISVLDENINEQQLHSKEVKHYSLVEGHQLLYISITAINQ